MEYAYLDHFFFSTSGTRLARNTNTKGIIHYFDKYIQVSTEEVRAFMTKLLHMLK